MHLSSFSADGFHRTISRADGTSGAGRGLNLETDQGFANFCRATFFVNVGFVFVAEMFECANNRVWSALSKTAETVAGNFVTQIFQYFDVAVFTQPVTDLLQEFEDTAGSHTARGAFSA